MSGGGAQRAALTLVELLVAMSIIGLLVGLLLPAVQQSREASRRSKCKNHLRQIALAALNHHDQHGFLPTGGWGFAWVGLPDQGFNRNQPGGWIYNLLPYLEQPALHDLGGGTDIAERRAASARRLRTPLGIFQCPSRRSALAYPTQTNQPHLRNPRETDTVLAVARADYAANAGDLIPSVPEGPSTLAAGINLSYSWPTTKKLTGICLWRSEVRLAQIVDGTSNTYYAGEKHLDPNDYATGRDNGDNESMYNGFCSDLVRYGRTPPLHDKVTARVPATDPNY